MPVASVVNDPDVVRNGQMPAVCALVVGLIVTFVATAFVREWEVRERRDLVAQASAGHVEALTGQLIRSREVLFAIESLFNARREITRTEFRDFVANTLSRHREIQGLAWDPRVPATARGQWEARARADGFESFQIVEQQHGALVPAGDRPEYFPVFFMENLSRNEPALGFDLRSEEKRRAALERARDTGLAAATPPIRLVQEPGSQLGFLVLLPIYERQVSSLEERRSSLRGFAVAVYRIGDLVDASLRAAVTRGLAVTVTDAESGEVIFTQAPAMPGGARWESTIDVAGRPWTLRFEASAALGGSAVLWQAWISMAAGIIITGLLSAYLWSHSRRTAELAVSNRALQAEIAIRKAAEATAQSATRAKSAFLANMSHEIRTPLNAILGYADILLRRDRLDAFQRDAVRTIAGSSGHLLHLINDILDLSKIDAGHMEMARANFDLQALVHEIAIMFQPLCEERNLTMCVDGLDHGHSLRVVGDAGKLRQALINLLGNAVKYTETGLVTLRLIERGESRWRFEVEDTGPGIPREIRDCIFEPFRQGCSGNEKGGTGLGLSIASRQVELMGGTLALESSADTGSLFAFTLHLPSAFGWRTPVTRSRERYRLAPGHRVRALVVDDVLENRRVLSTILTMGGCETLVAENGLQAIESVREFTPDIVFVDLRLPGLDGFETARQLSSELNGRLRVVATSASVLDGEQERSLADGCDAFVAKPFGADQIYDCVAAVLDVTFEVEQGSHSSVTPDGNEPEALALPEDLAARLTRAAEVHNATGLRTCLQELESLGPNGCRLADRLRDFLASYDMDAIQRLVGCLPARSAVGS
jgi:signal transduction histidine kinase/DNA-binding NarL/FixJ family response regulator